ncbi:TPA: hypothetical protein SVB51_001404 [Streptococcus equi subsp. equi]|nr:phage protein [Streptococcus equi subsp. equi]CRU20464.1 phage protein [Streptococcus equi subsp. equi]CRU52966.1 phage protein [Streptococcus equi subsp. equi]CRU69222.1 phage protein [Streptococcus equi subsp. equi]CRW38650.1 phage protein [Streptococcus equi subsp. equi]
MVKYLEFTDDWKNALDHLNDYVKNNKSKKVTVVGYSVYRHDVYGASTTNILVKVE